MSISTRLGTIQAIIDDDIAKYPVVNVMHLLPTLSPFINVVHKSFKHLKTKLTRRELIYCLSRTDDDYCRVLLREIEPNPEIVKLEVECVEWQKKYAAKHQDLCKWKNRAFDQRALAKWKEEQDQLPKDLDE